MRVGRLGCLGVTGLLLTVVGGAAVGLWIWVGIQTPPPLLATSPVRADAASVQRRVAEIDLRGHGSSRRREPLVFTEAEAAAWLARHLDDAGLRLSMVTVRLRSGRAVAQGKIPLKSLIQGGPWTQLNSVIPRRSLEAPVWITLAGTIGLESLPGRQRTQYAEATLVESRVGSLSIPGWLLASMMGPRGASLLRWPAPANVERVEVGEGQLTIRTR